MTSARLAVAPIAAFALSAVVVLVAARRPAPRPAGPTPLTVRALPGFLRYLVVLAVGGYGALLVIALVFGVLIVGDRRSLRDAALWGSFLIAVAVPVFASLTWLEGRLRRHR